jgi:transcriptional regulator with XRE-family HTH domain
MGTTIRKETRTMPADTLIRQRLAELVRDATKTRTQKHLADAAGVSQQVVSGILTGERPDLRAETVARLGRELGLSPTALGRLMYEAHPPKNSSEKIPDRG